MVDFGKAIAAYERLVVSRESRFDDFVDAIRDGQIENEILTSEERLGLKLFVGAGQCVRCHRGPNLTD